MACRWLRVLPVIVALVALSAGASVSMANAAPLPEAATASGGIVPQSANCSAGGQQDAHCLPGGPGSPPAGPGGPIHPPVTPPVTPPVIPPIVPPSGIPPATRPQDPEPPFVIMGWAKATLHIHDDDHDITYSAYHDTPGILETGSIENVPLVFVRRMVQDMPGATQYILASSVEGLGNVHVIWKVEGREFDCTIKGKAIVPFSDREGKFVDPTRDPSRPAWGYLNVVGPDGGDFYSVMVKAYSPGAYYTKTCPGDPPIVTKEPLFGAGYLLRILWQKNTHKVIFKGVQSHDEGDPRDYLNLLPPGASEHIPPEALEKLRQASGDGTSRRYTWEWELRGLVPKD